MRTIEITRMEDVRVGDAVVMGLGGVTVSGTLESPGTSLRPVEDWCMYFVGVGTLYARDGWTFMSATREVPEWEPGTAGTATVMGTPGVRVMRVQPDDRATDARPWFTDHTIGGWFAHAEGDVTDFKPDDAEALRDEVERLRAARTVPTREQVAMSMYAELKGAMDLSWGRLDPIDRGEWERAADTVLALIEQGGSNLRGEAESK